MKIAIIVVLSVLVLIVAWFFIQGYKSRSGIAPGMEKGRLMACPGTPNCVCSEYQADDSAFVAPIEFTVNDSKEAWGIIKHVIIEQGGTLKAERDGYLAAIFSSSVFGFVDDLEVRFDTDEGKLHFRSASRVGHSDFGVNRHRVEQLKKAFEKQLPKP